VFRGLKQAGIDLVTSVPCVKFAPFGDDNCRPKIIHGSPHGRGGIGICAVRSWRKETGIADANSGLALHQCPGSLDLLYDIPVVLIISTGHCRREDRGPGAHGYGHRCLFWRPSESSISVQS